MNRFIKSTVIGGLFFLIPVVVATAILGKALKITRSISVPLSEALGADSVKDEVFVRIITVVILILICFIAGLISQTIFGKKVFNTLDASLQKLIPGYTYIKNATAEFDSNQSASDLTPVIVTFDDQSQVAFEVERTNTEEVVIFLPGSPDPKSGNVVLVEANRVKAIDATFLNVSSTLKRFGKDTQFLFSKQ